MGRVVKLESHAEGLEWSDENEQLEGGTDRRKENVRRHTGKNVELAFRYLKIES